MSKILDSIETGHDERIVVGFDGTDDAAAVRLDDGRLLLQTVDFFTPVVDDPYQFGQIAAANSLSDIYAMGGKPLFALNIVGFPIKSLPREVLTRILQGGIDKAREAGISIVGGHSIDDPEPKYGLVVTGEVDESRMLTNSNARPGDTLILTKPLGTGIIATAIKRGTATESAIQAAVESMSQLNQLAAVTAQELDAHSVTDVTGFGLLGHLSEMCRASNVSVRVDFSALPFLPTVEQLVQADVIPGGTRRNLEYASRHVSFNDSLSDNQKLMAADAQTSGGLLVALPADKAGEFCSKYNSHSNLPAIKVGTFTESQKYLIKII